MARALDVVSTGKEYGIVCGRYARMFRPGRVRHYAYPSWADIRWPALARAKTTPLLIVSRLADIPDRAPIHPPGLGHRDRRYLLFSDRMPPEALPARVSRLNVRDSRRLHLAGATGPRETQAVIARTIRGLAGPAGDRIVDAWWEGDDFVVLSPEFRRLRVPLEKLSGFIGGDAGSIRAFEIDPDGSFVHWPHADVHLGWMQLLRTVDPLAVVAARAKRRDFDRRYGAAIQRARREARLRQSDVPGLSARQVGRIEKGECRATHSALAKLASAHRMGLAEYLDLLAGKLG